MYKKIIPFAVFLLLLLAPTMANAEGYCLNATWSRIAIATEEGGQTIDEYCPHGCDSGRGMCTDYSGTPGTAIPGELFILFELLAIGLLLGSLFDSEPDRKLLMSLIAMLLFFPLALMSNNVLFSGVAMEIEWLAWLNYGFAMISLLMVFASIFFVLRGETQEEGK